MRTTINIDDALFAEAAELTGVKAKTKLVRMALDALIYADAAKHLIALGGTMPDFNVTPRRPDYNLGSRPTQKPQRKHRSADHG